MAQSCYFLDGYPLYEHYHACWEFLDNEVDWSFHGKDATWFDISHVMRLFPHLTLDENYRLMCYLTSDFHGITGTIRALRKGIPSEPTVKSIFSDPRVDFFLGKEPHPPKNLQSPWRPSTMMVPQRATLRPCSVPSSSVHCPVLNHYSITGRPFSTSRPQIILPHGIHT